MNRLHIFGMMALAVAGLASCEPDDSPKIQEPTEFVLNTPPFASQLYQLKAGNTLELTCSQPNYGLTLAPEYDVEVSIYPDFGASLDPIDPDDEEAAPYSITLMPVNPFSAVIDIEDSQLSTAMLDMLGMKDEGSFVQEAHTLYVRAIASINSQAVTTIVSNIVTLAQVEPYWSREATYPVLYVPGDANGWNQEASMQLLGYERDDATKEWIKFRGLTYLKTGGFKFTDKPNWDGNNYGAATTNDSNDKNDIIAGHLSTDGGAPNLTVAENGLYYVTVDLKAMTYEATLVQTICAVGDFQGWNAASTAAALTPSADFKTWTYTGDFGDGGGFKFVINGGVNSNPWALNYGGPADECAFDGSNFSISGGQHTVTFNIGEIPYTTTIE